MELLFLLVLVVIGFLLFKIMGANETNARDNRMRLLLENSNNATITISVDWNDLENYSIDVFNVINSSESDQEIHRRLYELYKTKTGAGLFTFNLIMKECIKNKNVFPAAEFIFRTYQIFDRRFQLTTGGEIEKAAKIVENARLKTKVESEEESENVEDDKTELILVLDESESGYMGIQLDPQLKRYYYTGHPNDYESVFKSTNEYRFEGNNVFERTIEMSSENSPCDPDYQIKDSLVMESEIRRIYATRGCTDEEAQLELSELVQLTEWKEIKDRKIRAFILANHPELHFPPKESA